MLVSDREILADVIIKGAGKLRKGYLYGMQLLTMSVVVVITVLSSCRAVLAESVRQQI